MSARTVPLSSLPAGSAFVFASDQSEYPTVYEARGGGWYQVWGETENGGPWHCDGSTLASITDDVMLVNNTLADLRLFLPAIMRELKTSRRLPECLQDSFVTRLARVDGQDRLILLDWA